MNRKKIMIAVFLSVAMLGGISEVPEYLNIRTVSATAAQERCNFKYEENKTGITLTDCDKSLRHIEIPETVDGKTVTALGNGLFKNSEELTSIIIPETVTAFGENLFDGCEALQEIEIPSGIEYVSEDMFDYCKSLERIVVRDGNLNYTSKDGVLYSKDMKQLVFFPENSPIRNFTIPQGVVEILPLAFESCEKLESIELGDTHKIGDKAFSKCRNLKTVRTGENFSEAGKDVFKKLDTKNIAVYGYNNTFAKQFAESENISFSLLNDNISGMKQVIFGQGSSEEVNNIFDLVGEKQETLGISGDAMITESLTLDSNSLLFDSVGQTAELKINISPAGNKVTWHTSDSNVAVVNSDGKVTATGNGNARITVVSEDGKIAVADVSVKVPVSNIAVSETEVSFDKIGDTYKVNAEILPSDVPDKTVYWSSADPDIAEVSRNGEIKSVLDGTTKIFAMSSEGKTSEIVVNVSVAPQRIILSNENIRLDNIGDESFLIAETYPKIAGNAEISWASSDENIVTVDEDGNLKAVGGGSAVITASTENGITAECNVSVNVDIEKLEISNKDISINEIGALYFTELSVYPENTTETELFWKSLDENVATVDGNGIITAQGNGTTQILAVSRNGITASATVKVRDTAYWETAIEKSSLTLFNLGSSEVLNVLNGYGELKWSSSDENIARVNDNGVVTSTGYGKAIITLETPDHTFSECEVEVKMPVKSVTFDNKKISLGNSGDTVKLSAKTVPSESNLNWFSDNEDIATVDSNGTITAVRSGTAHITAIAENGTYAVCEVDVAGELKEISIEKNIVFSKAGEQASLNSENPDTEISWFSENPEIATVNNNGTVTAKATGRTRITAVGENGKTAYCEVEVNNLEADRKSVYFEDGYGKNTIETIVNSTSEWTVSSDAEWLEAVKADNKILITPQKNATGAERVANLTVSTAEQQLTIEVIQPSVSQLDTEFSEIADTGGNGDYYTLLPVNSVNDFSVKTDSEWIQLGNTDAQQNIPVGLSANESGITRSGNIIISDGTKTRIVEVTQFPRTDNIEWSAVVGDGGAYIFEDAFSDSATLGLLEGGEDIQLIGRKLINGSYRCRYGEGYGYIKADSLSESNNITVTGDDIILNVEDMKQFDDRWKYEPLGTYGDTIWDIGCTLTCVAMVESYRAGVTYYPDEMAHMLSFTAGGALFWPSDYVTVATEFDYQLFYEILKSGKPLIVGGGNSYTTHWCVIYGTQGVTLDENGNPSNLTAENFLINDPGSSYRFNLAEYYSHCPEIYVVKSY